MTRQADPMRSPQATDRAPATPVEARRPGPPRTAGALGFALLVCAIVLLLHIYPAVRLLAGADVMSTSLSVLTGGVLAVTMLTLFISGHIGGRDLRATVGDVWLGVAFQLFVWTLFGEVLRLVLWAADAPGRGVLVSVVVAAWTVLVLLYGLRTALGPVPIRRVEVRLPRLHRDLDGLRIVQITDTHLSRILGQRWMTRIVHQVNGIEADICCHTGDLADGAAPLREAAVGELGRVAHPHKYYITGNHEYFGDAEHWARRMGELGWDFLHNRHVVYRRGRGELVIAGIDDPTGTASGLPGHGPDLARALEGAPGDAAVLLLAHQPKQARQAAEYGADLQLAGHTHGGQMWPFHLLVRADQKFVSGLHSVTERTQLYVSRGTGFWGPPFRIGARPEITVLTLRAG